MTMDIENITFLCWFIGIACLVFALFIHDLENCI